MFEQLAADFANRPDHRAYQGNTLNEPAELVSRRLWADIAAPVQQATPAP
jgi:hypothetical protein